MTTPPPTAPHAADDPNEPDTSTTPTGSSAIPADTPLTLELTHGQLRKKLLDVYMAGFGSGYMSALTQMGTPEAPAQFITRMVLAQVEKDPIASNTNADLANARFHDDDTLLPPAGPINIGCPCGNCHPEGGQP